MQTKSISQNPPIPYNGNSQLALVTPKNPPSPTPPKSIEKMEVVPKPAASPTLPKPIEKTEVSPKPSFSAPSTTNYYVPSAVVPKVNMQEEVIFFETGKANISEKAFILLDNMAQKMAQNPHLNLQINGYSNENQENKFSNLRAEAVQGYLRSKGIDKARLPIKAFGNSNISNYSSQCGKVDFAWSRR